MTLTSYVFWLMDDLCEKGYILLIWKKFTLQICERPQQTFLWYRQSWYLMGHKDKMAFYHHHFYNTSNAACTGTAEIMTEPKILNERLPVKKRVFFNVKRTLLVRNKHLHQALIAPMQLAITLVMEDERKYHMQKSNIKNI